MSVLNCVLYVPSCLTCLACPHALRALVPYVPSRLTYPRALRTLVPYVPSCLTCIKVYLVGCFWYFRVNRTKSCFGWFMLGSSDRNYIKSSQRVNRGDKVTGEYRWRSSFFSKVTSCKPTILLKMNSILSISLQLHFFFQQFTFFRWVLHLLILFIFIFGFKSITRKSRSGFLSEVVTAIRCLNMFLTFINLKKWNYIAFNLQLYEWWTLSQMF